MDGFKNHLQADRRLAILRLLVEAGGEAGESVLEKGLHMLGHRAGVDRDRVRRDLNDLKELACLEIDFFQGTIMVAAISQRGVSVAKGIIEVEGIARPAMGR